MNVNNQLIDDKFKLIWSLGGNYYEYLSPVSLLNILKLKYPNELTEINNLYNSLGEKATRPSLWVPSLPEKYKNTIDDYIRDKVPSEINKLC